MNMKKCRICLVEKRLSDFTKDSRNKTGKSSKCTTCQHEYYKQSYLKNPDVKKKSEIKYRKKNLIAIKKKKADYYLINKLRLLQQKNIWTNNNLHKRRAVARKSANLRRARKLNNGFENYTENQVLDAYGLCCHICEKPIDFNAPRKAGILGWQFGFQIDHLIPISKGGPDRLDNVRPSHGVCNLTKRNKIIK